MTLPLRLIPWLALGVIVLTLAGCLKVSQTLTLNRDGSGTLDVRYRVGESSLTRTGNEQRMPGRRGGDEAIGDPRAARVRDEFERHKPEGIKLASIAMERVDGWDYVHLEILFDDLRALRRTSVFRDAQLLVSRDAAGNYVLLQREGDPAGARAETLGPLALVTGDGGSESRVRAEDATHSPALVGVKIVNAVVVPTPIVDSNATVVDGNRATWVLSDGSGLAAPMDGGSGELRIVFSADGVHLPDMLPD